MSYSVTYDSDFDGADFLELFDGGQGGTDGDQELAFAMFHHPGTNTNTFQGLGKLHQTFEVRAAVNGATDRDALKGKLGTSGTLTFGRGTFSSCRLVGVTAIKKHRKLDVWTMNLRLVKP